MKTIKTVLHIQNKMDKLTNYSIDAVEYALSQAKEYNSEPEVVTYALKYMKEDPTLSIEEAINKGLDEWIK